MSKKLAVKLAAALALVISGAAAVKAAQTATLNVTLTMSNLDVSNVGGAGISLSGGPGQVVVASTSTGRGIFKNTGATNETFQVNCNVGQNPWFLVTGNGAITPEQYRLRAIWNEWNVQPSTSSYQDNDILSATPTNSSATVFYDDSLSNSATWGGYQVPVDAERSLFIMAELPPSPTPKPTESNVITITAVLP